jgi:hypothetical protein
MPVKPYEAIPSKNFAFCVESYFQFNGTIPIGQFGRNGLTYITPLMVTQHSRAGKGGRGAALSTE